jgi:hypothetical protein
MRAYTAIGVLAVGAIGAMFLCVRPADAIPSPTPNKFVGSSLSTVTYQFGDDVLIFDVLATVHADGTISTTDGTDHLGNQFAVLDGPTCGNWTMIGPNTFKATILWQSFDANGAVAYIGRNDFTSTNVEGADYDFEGAGVVRLYFPGTDPFDIDAGVVAGTWTMNGRYIEP